MGSSIPLPALLFLSFLVLLSPPDGCRYIGRTYIQLPYFLGRMTCLKVSFDALSGFTGNTGPDAQRELEMLCVSYTALGILPITALAYNCNVVRILRVSCS